MADPSIRTITFQWINSQMSGDELLELWKKVAGVWSLVESIPVASTPEQTHEFTGSPGTAYAFQMRARRNGLYRAEYQSTDPEDWPSASRLDYTADLPVPVLSFIQWRRDSATDQYLVFHFANIDPARTTKLYRDDGGGYDLVFEVAAGTDDYGYLIPAPESATYLNFKIVQEDDDLAEGPTSNILFQYAGPSKPTALAQVGGPDNGEYTAQWTVGQPGAQTRLSDHWIGSYQNRTLSAGGATSGTVGPLETDSFTIPDITVQVAVRARHEITAFAVTDVSDWTNDVLFDVRTQSTNTLYGGP